MFCCNEQTSLPAASSISYSPVSTDEKQQQKQRSSKSFPGMHRTISSDTPPKDCMLIKTGGTALQAIPKEQVLQDDVVAVSVPENVHPGQEILVKAPPTNGILDGRCIRATVPEGALPGHTFLVKFDSTDTQHDVVAVMGVPVEQDLLLSMDTDEKKNTPSNTTTVVDTPVVAGQMLHQPVAASMPPVSNPQQQQQPTLSNGHGQQQQHDGNRILVKVPPGVLPGEKIRVKIPDGRTIDATVPAGETEQFYVQVPPKHQNWHDNPLAYGAPMIVAPLLL